MCTVACMSEQRTHVDVDPLLAKIQRALTTSGESRTRFGYFVGGDPTLVGKMERGRKIEKPALRQSIEARVALLMKTTQEAESFLD